MNVKKLAVIEALLFTTREPVSLKELAEVVELTPNKTKKYMEVLKKEYKKRSHGIQIKEYDNCYIFETKPKMAPFIKELHSVPKITTLTQAALETLAIIAYKQPVTRSEIETIRGVKAEKTLLTLTKYNLIKELGRKDTIGNPIVYGTTAEFLQHFNISNLSELPEIDDLENINELDQID